MVIQFCLRYSKYQCLFWKGQVMKVKTNTGEEIEISFQKSFFDSFKGTDAELQEAMQRVIDMVKNDTLMETAELIDIEDLSNEEQDDLATSIFGIKDNLQ